MTMELVNATADMNKQIDELMSYVFKNIPMETYRDMDPMVLNLLQNALKLTAKVQKVCAEQAITISRMDDKLNKITELLEHKL